MPPVPLCLEKWGSWPPPSSYGSAAPRSSTNSCKRLIRWSHLFKKRNVAGGDVGPSLRLISRIWERIMTESWKNVMQVLWTNIIIHAYHFVIMFVACSMFIGLVLRHITSQLINNLLLISYESNGDNKLCVRLDGNNVCGVCGALWVTSSHATACIVFVSRHLQGCCHRWLL